MKIQTYRFDKDHLLMPLKTIFFFHKRKKNHPVTPIHGDTNLFFVKNSTLFNSLCYLFISLILFICYFPGSMYMLRISLLKKLTTLGCVLFITESGTSEKLIVSSAPFCPHPTAAISVLMSLRPRWFRWLTLSCAPNDSPRGARMSLTPHQVLIVDLFLA